MAELQVLQRPNALDDQSENSDGNQRSQGMVTNFEGVSTSGTFRQIELISESLDPN